MDSAVDLFFRHGLGGLVLLALSLAIVLAIVGGVLALLAAFVRGFTGTGRTQPDRPAEPEVS